MPQTDIDNLKEWVEQLRTQLIELHINRYFYQEVAKILASNPKLEGLPGDYPHFAKGWYEYSMSMAIRRLVDDDNRTRSFVRFLIEVEKNHSRLNRSHYKECLKWRIWATDAELNAEFEFLCGVGAKFLQKDTVLNDKKALESGLFKIEKYANEFVAHRPIEPKFDLPNHTDIDEALKLTGELLNKYSKIINGHGVGELLPYIPGDWKDLFRVPWINNK